MKPGRARTAAAPSSAPPRAVEALTREEEEHGFQLVEREGCRLAVLALPEEIFIVRIVARNGFRYVMCAQGLEPVLSVARTLDELLARYD